MLACTVPQTHDSVNPRVQAIIEAAGKIWKWGANPVAIRRGDKTPCHKWKNDGLVETLMPKEKTQAVGAFWRRGEADRIGIVHGVGDFVCIDLDARKDVETPIDLAVAGDILRDLRLIDGDDPLAYPWCGRSGGGRGIHIWARVPDRPRGDIAGVIVLTPKEAARNAGVGRIEIRFHGHMTALPSHDGVPGYNRSTFHAPPAIVSWERLILAATLVGELPSENDDRAPRRIEDGIDVEAASRAIDAAWDGATTARWFAQELHADTQDERNGEIRVLGQGGLLIKPTGEWFNFSVGRGGRWAKAIAETRFDGRVPSGSEYISLLKIAAEFAGVNLDAYRKPLEKKAAGGAAKRTEDERSPVEAFLDWLRDRGYAFRRNALRGDEYAINGGEWREFTDDAFNTLWAEADLDGVAISAERALRHISRLAGETTVHPVQDWLNSLTWDGDDHIARLASYFTIASDDCDTIEYADGTRRSIFEAYLRRWLIGAVRRAFTGKHHAALVLDGPQGVGKSHFARWLCPDALQAFFVSRHLSPHDRDEQLNAARTFIWEIAEIDATTNRHDIAAIKAFLSQETFTVRPAYARRAVTLPALASFIGTINNSAGFLSDPTGSRRFLVVTVTSIDRRYAVDIDVARVWAQAVALWRSGESGDLTPEENAARAVRNEAYQRNGVIYDIVAGEVVKGDNDDYLTTAELYEVLKMRYAALPALNRGVETEIGNAMRLLFGDCRKRIMHNGVRRYVYAGVRLRIPAQQP